MRKGLRTVTAQILLSPGDCSLKRIAWAYGCSPRDSDEERQLRDLLVAKAKVEP